MRCVLTWSALALLVLSSFGGCAPQARSLSAEEPGASRKAPAKEAAADGASSSATRVAKATSASAPGAADPSPAAGLPPTKGAGPAASPECRVRVVVDDDIVRLDWLGVYQRIVGTQGAEWGLGREPRNAAEARRAACWETSGSVGEPPRAVNTCEGTEGPWRVTTFHHGSYVDEAFYVWPLSREHAVLFATLEGGSLCSMGQPSSLVSHEGRSFGDFSVVTRTLASFDWNEASEECVEQSRESTMWIYDAKLTRGFRVEGLTSAEQVTLESGSHALGVADDACLERVDLASVVETP